MTFKHGVVMSAEADLGTKEERKLHFKKEFGKSMYLKNRHCES